MHVCMDAWMNGWMDRRTHERTDAPGRERGTDAGTDGWGTSGVYMWPISSFILPFQAARGGR